MYDCYMSKTNKTKEQPLSERGSNRSQRPRSENFKEFIGSNWGPRPDGLPERAESADYAAKRREALSQLFEGDCLVIPAGPLKVRNNDCDYRFRPHSAFAHMTGMGTDQEPDAVLVLVPISKEAGVGVASGVLSTNPAYELTSNHSNHKAVLYFRPRASRSSEEFYADSRYGELWVGVRASLEEIESQTGIACAHIKDLENDLKLQAESATIRVVADSDPAVTELVNKVRGQKVTAIDDDLHETLSTLRLCKDKWELQQMQLAVDTTKKGFEEIIKSLPRAIEHHRGERVVEGAFAAVSREEGNGTGYDTIAACGNHANTLHWICNDGPVREGEMILVDAGVEVDSLYTADITRTLPVTGKFSEVQKKIYQAVLDAADAAFEKANEPGVIFRDMHAAALSVLAHRLEEWGLLPVSAEESLKPEGQYHCRWMVHGTSHHLGIDVHDCALARREMYLDAELKPGMCFTIEPGLYFREDDLTVPEEFRGNAVRIEDDLYIDETGKCIRMSDNIPRTIEEVETWMSDLMK
ncbi:aminopeptidase P family protein [Actinomyces sp. zg-332]|nr:aminopeptidase P family protein [Actinomyces sp. zg-332]